MILTDPKNRIVYELVTAFATNEPLHLLTAGGRLRYA